MSIMGSDTEDNFTGAIHAQRQLAAWSTKAPLYQRKQLAPCQRLEMLSATHQRVLL